VRYSAKIKKICNQSILQCNLTGAHYNGTGKI